MTTYEALHESAAPVLHVFEQDGGWHWGITVPRPAGSGFKVVAFSEKSFPAEAAARTDGDRVLRAFSDDEIRERAH